MWPFNPVKLKLTKVIKKIGELIRLSEKMRVKDRYEGRWRSFESNVRPNMFRKTVEFIYRNYGGYEPIHPTNLVKIPGCPIKDPEVASKYLELMQGVGLLHLKSIYARGKVWFIGCTREEEDVAKRAGLESWVGIRVEEFMRRHRLVGDFALRRIYRFIEYGEPLLRVLSVPEENMGKEAGLEPPSPAKRPAIF